MIAEAAAAVGECAEPKARVFISYSRKDMAFADRLDAALKARGFEPAIDRTEIYSFEDWWKRIQALIGKADTVIFVLSPDAVASDTCRTEVMFASSLNKRFAPVLYRSIDSSRVPAPLARLNFLSFEDWSSFENNADKLAEALSTDIEWIRKHTEFGELSRRWSEAGSPQTSGLLLRSPVLEEAERWLARQPQDAPSPTEATRTLIVASRKAENLARVRARRTRIVLGVLGLTLVGASGGLLKYEYLKDIYYFRVVMEGAPLTAERERALKAKDEFAECKKGCPVMVVVPAGSFTMGSPMSENDRSEDEGPQHEVTFAKPFAVGKYDVTFTDWDVCVDAGACPPAVDIDSYGSRRTDPHGDRPLIEVSWDEAKRYVAWLSRLTGKEYRLPSEAEWEYAARAGTTTAYYWGDEIGTGNANCSLCGSQWDKAAPVGSFNPNALGLYDMAGNASQWVEDVYHQNYDGAPNDGSAWIEGEVPDMHVTRGGAWVDGPPTVRVAARSYTIGIIRGELNGFRVARTLTP